MANLKHTLFAMLLLIPTISFAADCDVQFQKTLNIRVLDDEDFFPVEGAGVWLTYQKQYLNDNYNSITRYTPANGQVSILAVNNEVQESVLECDIKINVQLDDQYASKIVPVTTVQDPVNVLVPASYLTVRVLDDQDQPVSGANVWVDSARNKTTNSSGSVLFTVGNGEHRILATHGSSSAERTIDIQEDTQLLLQFLFSRIEILVVDDNGNQLPATIVLDGRVYESNGSLEVGYLASTSPDLTITYNRIEKKVDVDLLFETSYVIAFDFTAPSINPPQISKDENSLSLTTAVFDPGEYASGINTSSFSAEYLINSTGSWQRATSYTVANNKFKIELPPQSGGSLIDVRMELRDNAGNRQIRDVEFSIVAQAPTNTTQGDTNNNSEDEQGGFQDLPAFMYIFIGILIIIVILYIFYKVKMSKEAG